MAINDLLKQGIAALKAGYKTEARSLLMQVVQQDERNESAWLWLSGAVDTDEERRICLENVLAINPNNRAAERGLQSLITKEEVRSLDTVSQVVSSPGLAAPWEPTTQRPAAVTTPDVTLHQRRKVPDTRRKPSRKRTGLLIGLGTGVSLIVCGTIAGISWVVLSGLLSLRSLPTSSATTEPPSIADVTLQGPVSPTDTWTRPADGMVMVYVPAGEFQMGSTDDEVDYALQLCYGDCERYWFDGEQPVHTVVLDGFWIDQTEVTNAQYRRCVGAGYCRSPTQSSSYTRASYYGNSTYDDYPVIHVSWRQAATYCEWAEARLPTEAQWEYAARGSEGQVFPWGNTFDGARLNYCDSSCRFDWAASTVDDGYADTAPVGSYRAGASWCGALDMAGNVYEWVADWYGAYSTGRLVNPTGVGSGEFRVLRGGSWDDDARGVRSAWRIRWSGAEDDAGFRCARDSE
jgi:formylglycine-generating enzyme required for sulfatase activity